MADTHWMIGDGRSVDIMHDIWIADLPLARWPTFLSMDIPLSSPVSALLCPDRSVWHAPTVLRLFGVDLARRILSIPLGTSVTSDLRLWRRSSLPRAPLRDLADIFCSRASGLDDISWLWRLPLHPRTLLFLWKLAWDRLPTCSLLAGRGLSLSPLCPRCGLDEETTEHAILTCPLVVPVWQLLHYSPQVTPQAPPRLFLLRDIQLSFQRGGSCSHGALLAHHALQIWLTRNQFIFAGEVISAEVVSRRASASAVEYSSSDATAHFGRSGLWGSSAAPAAHRSPVFISWEPPPPGFAKVNFDGSVSGRSAGSGFVIRGPDGALLAAGGFGSIGSSVPQAELQAAWAGISFAVRHLGIRNLVIEGDSLTVIRWIRREIDVRPSPPPLIQDIWSFLLSTSELMIRHVFREANTVADWVAAFVVRHSGQ